MVVLKTLIIAYIYHQKAYGIIFPGKNMFVAVPTTRYCIGNTLGHVPKCRYGSRVCAMDEFVSNTKSIGEEAAR